MHVLGQRRQDRTQIEQLVLHAQQDRGQDRQLRLVQTEFMRRGAGGAEERIQLVHGSVSFDARAVFGYALPSGERGLALVTQPRVDAIDGEPGLIEGFFLMLIHRALEMVHFMPATKFSRGEGNP